MELDEKSLRILSCDISVRPGVAAGIAEVLPYVLSVKTDDNSVLVEFDEAGVAAVQSFVAAERLCCNSLTWELAHLQDGLQLRVMGVPELDC